MPRPSCLSPARFIHKVEVQGRTLSCRNSCATSPLPTFPILRIFSIAPCRSRPRRNSRQWAIARLRFGHVSAPAPRGGRGPSLPLVDRIPTRWRSWTLCDRRTYDGTYAPTPLGFPYFGYTFPVFRVGRENAPPISPFSRFFFPLVYVH